MQDRKLTPHQVDLYNKIATEIRQEADRQWNSGSIIRRIRGDSIFDAGFNPKAYAHPVFWCEVKSQHLDNPSVLNNAAAVDAIIEQSLDVIIDKYMPQIVKLAIERQASVTSGT